MKVFLMWNSEETDSPTVHTTLDAAKKTAQVEFEYMDEDVPDLEWVWDANAELHLGMNAEWEFRRISEQEVQS